MWKRKKEETDFKYIASFGNISQVYSYYRHENIRKQKQRLCNDQHICDNARFITVTIQSQLVIIYLFFSFTNSGKVKKKCLVWQFTAVILLQNVLD